MANQKLIDLNMDGEKNNKLVFLLVDKLEREKQMKQIEIFYILKNFVVVVVVW